MYNFCVIKSIYNQLKQVLQATNSVSSELKGMKYKGESKALWIKSNAGSNVDAEQKCILALNHRVILKINQFNISSVTSRKPV